jgi:hypothetical protein
MWVPLRRISQRFRQNISLLALRISSFREHQIKIQWGSSNGSFTDEACIGATLVAGNQNAYLGVNSALQSLPGSGQTVGIVEFDVFNRSDIQGYDALQNQSPKLNDANVSIVATEGGNPLAGSNKETTLDVEMVQAMAPNALIKVFQGSTGITAHLDDILHAMATFTPQLNE